MNSDKNYPGALGIKNEDQKLPTARQYQEAVNEYILTDGLRIKILSCFNKNVEQRAEEVWERFVRSRTELERTAVLYANEKWPGNRQLGFEFLVASAEKEVISNGCLTGVYSKDELNAALIKWAKVKVAFGV